jgi:hypothetical protein
MLSASRAREVADMVSGQCLCGAQRCELEGKLELFPHCHGGYCRRQSKAPWDEIGARHFTPCFCSDCGAKVANVDPRGGAPR